MEETYKDDLVAGAVVMGAHQFLAEHAGVEGDDKPTAITLRDLNAEKGSVRMTGGNTV